MLTKKGAEIALKRCPETPGLNREKVSNIIDKCLIEQSLNNGDSFYSIKINLQKRIGSIFNIAKKDFKTVDELLRLGVPGDSDPRLRYAYLFISCTDTRLKDIDWLCRNRYKKGLRGYNNLTLFKLINLRNKLKNETY